MSEKKLINPRDLTLDQIWIYQLKMSGWIAGEIENGSGKDVIDLKAEWIEENNFNPDQFVSKCFFCTYGIQAIGCPSSCPGKLVDPEFDCVSNEYCYSTRPSSFYNELQRLNGIRIEVKHGHKTDPKSEV